MLPRVLWAPCKFGHICKHKVEILLETVSQFCLFTAQDRSNYFVGLWDKHLLNLQNWLPCCDAPIMAFKGNQKGKTMVSGRVVTGWAIWSSHWVNTVCSDLRKISDELGIAWWRMLPTEISTGLWTSTFIQHVPAEEDPKTFIVIQEWKGHCRPVFLRVIKNKQVKYFFLPILVYYLVVKKKKIRVCSFGDAILFIYCFY